MSIGWLESIIYGIVVGFTEFVPVSAQAHRLILQNILGMGGEHSLLAVFTRLGALFALLSSSGAMMRNLYREYRQSRPPKRRRKKHVDIQAVLDIRLVKFACFPLVFGIFLYINTMQWNQKIPVVAAWLVLNGVILYFPQYLAHGNKDSRNMNRFDSILIGIGAMLAAIPGVSGIGAASSIAVARGADTQQAYKWSLLLSAPILSGLLCFDMYALITGGFSGVGFLFFIQCVLSGITAYLGGRLAVAFMKAMASRSGFSNFSYYVWGASLFMFILYLY